MTIEEWNLRHKDQPILSDTTNQSYRTGIFLKINKFKQFVIYSEPIRVEQRITLPSPEIREEVMTIEEWNARHRDQPIQSDPTVQSYRTGILHKNKYKQFVNYLESIREEPRNSMPSTEIREEVMTIEEWNARHGDQRILSDTITQSHHRTGIFLKYDYVFKQFEFIRVFCRKTKHQSLRSNAQGNYI